MTACLLLVSTLLMAADRRSAKNSREIAEADPVEMFDAMKAGDIDVSFIPKDSSEARVVIKNKTDKPLNLKLPEAFAGVPVLAQARGGAAPGRPGGAPQPMGGGMGGMGGMGMGGMGGGMGMMNIPAEKVAQFKVPTVCLEHGKREPRSSMRYEIKPIDSYTTKPEIKELLTVFGKQHLNQRATQAAAWHLASGMSWDQLVNKRIDHLGGSSEPWFSPLEIQAALQIAQYSVVQAEENAKARSPEETSLNQSASKDE